MKGKKLGWSALQEYATLVTPATLLAWHRQHSFRIAKAQNSP